MGASESAEKIQEKEFNEFLSKNALHLNMFCNFAEKYESCSTEEAKQSFLDGLHMMFNEGKWQTSFNN